MLTIQCAICGKKQKIVELYPATFSLKKVTSKIFSARRIPDRMHYRIVRCTNCQLLFSNPILSSDKIKDLYRDSDFYYDREAIYAANTYWKYVKPLVPPNNLKKIELLDIGCGNGFFIEKALEQGIDAFGIEPGAASINKAKKNIKKRIKNSFLKINIFPKNSFDVVTCFQTLDHVIDPNIFLKNILSILKPGGKVVIICHNTEGLSAKLFGEKSPIFDIEHIYLFNQKNLKQLLQKNDFIVKDTFTVKNTYPLSYWISMSPLPNRMKQGILLLLSFIRLSDQPFKISAGNIGIIAEKNIQK